VGVFSLKIVHVKCKYWLKVKSYFDIFKELDLKIWDFVRTENIFNSKKIVRSFSKYTKCHQVVKECRTTKIVFKSQVIESWLRCKSNIVVWVGGCINNLIKMFELPKWLDLIESSNSNVLHKEDFSSHPCNSFSSP
jgi:hypothetical protein